MRKIFSLVFCLIGALVFTTIALADTGWDFSVESVEAVAEQSRTGNYYRVYVTVWNESTSRTYSGYGTVRVNLKITNPDGDAVIFRDSEKAEIKNGSSEEVEFRFNKDVHYSYLDYRVSLMAPNHDGLFDTETGNLDVDWD